MKISARKLLGCSTEQLVNNLAGNFIVCFDDCEVETNAKQVIYSSYVWDYHRQYPNTAILSKHLIKGIIQNKRLGANTHLDLINSVLWTVYDTYKTNSNQLALLDDLAKKAYDISSGTMYNDLTYNLEEYVTSLDITDFINVTKHPEIEKAMDEMPSTQEGIDDVYSIIKRLFKEDVTFQDNPLVCAVNSGLANMGQALQCVGPRGFLTDVDSNIFPNPIRKGFVHGIRSLHDSMIETRSAAKSLMFSVDPLQQAEYFSRRQQLICQNVRNLHLGDCGSTNYLDWHVRDARYEGTTKISNSDLLTLVGKYYLDEDVNKLKALKVDDIHLIGKVIKLRSPIAGCSHPDPYGVCEVCYGQTALAIPANANLGHIACVAMTAEVGQNILSTKHFDGSSVVEGIVLKPEEKKYLNATINGNLYFLNDGLKKYKVEIIADPRCVNGLTDISLIDDIYKLSLSRISEFEALTLRISGSKDTEITTLDVSINGRLSSMSYELLNFIKTAGWSVDDNGNYIIDLTGWDHKSPILVLPLRHYNMSNHQVEIAKLLESTVDELESRSAVIRPASLLTDFHDLVNRRLSVNLSLLEIILYSSMGVNPMENNYALHKTWTTSGIGVMRQLIQNRSLSATMSYQGHRDVLTNPSNYIGPPRLDHIFDAIVCPVEALS